MYAATKTEQCRALRETIFQNGFIANEPKTRICCKPQLYHYFDKLNSMNKSKSTTFWNLYQNFEHIPHTTTRISNFNTIEPWTKNDVIHLARI